MQVGFGSGVFWGTPLTDAEGNPIANPTPVQLGGFQDMSLDISFETKTLHGQGIFPITAGRGKGKITGQVKYAQISGAAFNSLVFGQTMTSGLVSAYSDVAGVVIPATPFAVTVSPQGSGTFAADLGVRNSNGVPMTRVASAPATGQYSLNATGVYTFAAADTGKTVFISYSYTATSTTAKKGTVTNLLMGSAPVFKADMFITHGGKTLVFTLPKCIASKLGISTKQDDFLIPEMGFEAFANDLGEAIFWGTAE